jgi:hypothetical protein
MPSTDMHMIMQPYMHMDTRSHTYHAEGAAKNCDADDDNEKVGEGFVN